MQGADERQLRCRT